MQILKQIFVFLNVQLDILDFHQIKFVLKIVHNIYIKIKLIIYVYLLAKLECLLTQFQKLVFFHVLMDILVNYQMVNAKLLVNKANLVTKLLDFVLTFALLAILVIFILLFVLLLVRRDNMEIQYKNYVLIPAHDHPLQIV